MQTLFILEYQANNDGSCTITPALGYTDDTHTVMITNSEGEVWQGYKQTLRHGHEVEE